MNTHSKKIPVLLFIFLLGVAVSLILTIVYLHYNTIDNRSLVINFGEQSGIRFDTNRIGLKNIVTFEGDSRLHLSYIPQIRSNYSELRVELEEKKTVEQMGLALDISRPENIFTIQMRSNSNDNWETMYVEQIANLGEPKFTNDTIQIWSSDNLDEKKLEDALEGKYIPGYSLYNYNHIFTNNAPSVTSQSKNYQHFLHNRGSLNGYIYINSENPTIGMRKYDLNKSIGKDPVSVSFLGTDGTLVHEIAMPDDGVTSERSTVGVLQTKQSTTSLLPGVYRFEITAGDSVITEIFGDIPLLVIDENYFIATTGFYLAGANRQIKNSARKVSALYSGAEEIQIDTIHDFALGRSSFGKNSVRLRKINKQYTLYKGRYARNDLRVQKEDARIYAKGYIATSRAAYFEPFPKYMQEIDAYTKIQSPYIVFANMAKISTVDETTMRLEEDIHVNRFNTNTLPLEILVTDLERARSKIDIKNITIQY